MPPLSEKAQGKQRAVAPNSEAPLAKDLTIRFTEGIPDLTLQVAEKDEVRDVKRNIRAARPQLKDRRLRLIHSGQLLPDATLLYPRLVSAEDRQRRNASVEGAAEDQEPATSNAWLHCSVGPQMTEGESEEEGKVQTAQLKPLRGFDRLASAGFSEQDIANIRMQFHAHSAGDYLDQDWEGEDFDEHARALEEQWIDSFDGGNAPLSQSSSGASSTILHGIVLGFFFPIIPFFFFRLSKPAVFWDDGTEHDALGASVFSRRMQIGIVAGFLLNSLFGMWTYLLTSP
ncbi:hypothetical protein CERSUDRAFT_112427 [Gelatoporia subvermispora B]|uniref:Ubiquitin-like domain-containing protein n=1 Tax=Ceriporiopsis subvermispora (strain B) TaxID=914234 RepID=M2PU21_CERS8|nr:hypothetical protein CERSUDRAFT_112427 [Gelatoporia subvermispora B]